jgi:hypothetical protein
MSQNKDDSMLVKKKSKSDDAVSSGFYPEEGTVFIKEGNPCIVESSQNLSVLSNEETDVAYWSFEDGYSDFLFWHQAVHQGTIDIVWCPKKGRVESNQVYLGSRLKK